MTAAILAQIEHAPLSAATYRTARRLLDRAQHGAVRLPRAQMCELAGTDADSTMRRHLIALAQAGIIAYTARGETVLINFPAWQEDDHQARKMITTRAKCSPDAQEDDHQARKMITTRAECSPDAQEDDHQARKMITTRAKRSSDEHLPHTHARARVIGCLLDPLHPNGEEGEQPTNQTTGARPIDAAALKAKELRHFGAQPDTPEHAFAFGLLVDPDVAIAPHTARELAGYGPDEVLRQVAYWLERKAEGEQIKQGLLVKAIRERWPAPPAPASFKAGEYYRRHHPGYDPDQEHADQVRSQYIPDEYSDVIIS